LPLPLALTYQKHKKINQELQAAIDLVRAKGLAEVSNSLFESATGGNVTAQIFYLKTSAPLFLRKLILGIPAQVSGKNHVAINAYGASIRPAFVSLRHIIASSMQTP